MSKTKGMVAAGHELTARAAAEILEDGGNAFDAALAGVFMTFVAEAVFSSPGGGGFLMGRRENSDSVRLIDFFTETPLNRRPANEVEFFPIYADFGPAKQEFHIGLGSSATPGAVPGIFVWHEALCTLPMRRLVEPAVRAARTGFALTEFQAYLFTVIAPILTASSDVAKIFAPGGKLMKAGETFRNEWLAEMLEWLAEDGARLFVDGDVGKAIVAQSLSLGGHLTYEDLKRYRIELREPLYWRHKGATVALNPPPAASGPLIAFGLAYLEVLQEAGGKLDALALKWAMEATNEARTTHGESLAARLAGGVLARELREAQRHPQAYRGTTHVSVIDEEGNAAAASLSNGEGNGYIVGNFGFMLNNMLGEEDLPAGGLDGWREGARLSSMMAPTIILEPDGAVTALGTGGSNRIRTAILQVAVNLLDHRMSLEDAVEAPRLHVEGDGKTSFEPGLPETVQAELLALGESAHAWPARNLFFGGVHAARRHPTGGMDGAGDPRRQGVAIAVEARRSYVANCRLDVANHQIEFSLQEQNAPLRGASRRSIMKNAVAIRHIAFEDAGILAGVLERRGFALNYLEAGVDDLSPAKTADLVIVLGGPIGIYEVDRYPFLTQELATIETAVKKGVPTIGICLGSQVLAAVFGARVYPNLQKELGWDEITLTKEGKASPLGVIEGVRVLNWHGDTFDLPLGATRLASTKITPNQAFAYGPKVLALQFHVELPQRDMERWLIGHTLELANSKADLGKMRADAARFAHPANQAGHRLFNDWLDGITASSAAA